MTAFEKLKENMIVIIGTFFVITVPMCVFSMTLRSKLCDTIKEMESIRDDNTALKNDISNLKNSNKSSKEQIGSFETLSKQLREDIGKFESLNNNFNEIGKALISLNNLSETIHKIQEAWTEISNNLE